MDEQAPPRWHEERAAAVTPLLRALVLAMTAWRP
jgi:hypothetical protein